METVNIKINNVPYTVKAGSTILEACHEVGIDIPTLCYLKEINEIGACRICVVEVKEPAPSLPPASIPSTRAWRFTPTRPRLLSPAR